MSRKKANKMEKLTKRPGLNIEIYRRNTISRYLTSYNTAYGKL